jgi:hypothetical protein
VFGKKTRQGPKKTRPLVQTSRQWDSAKQNKDFRKIRRFHSSFEQPYGNKHLAEKENKFFLKILTKELTSDKRHFTFCKA